MHMQEASLRAFRNAQPPVPATLMHASPIEPGERTRRFYVEALTVLDEAGLDYVVGGGYAMAFYTGIRRNTKDLDIFVRPEDHRRILQELERAGYRGEYFYPFWIAKAVQGEDFIDILYNSGNGQCRVDDDWITNAREVEILGYRTRLVPPEEQLWSKSFVMDRDRYDGADVLHLIMSCGEGLDWARLLRRFAGHERVLLSHLVLFDYAFPSERAKIPHDVMDHLLSVAADRRPGERVCYGPNVSQQSFLPDVHERGLADGRLQPVGPLTEADLSQLPAH